MNTFATTIFQTPDPVAAIQSADLADLSPLLGSLQMATPQIDSQLSEGISAATAFVLANTHEHPEIARHVAREALVAFHTKYADQWMRVGHAVAPHLLFHSPEDVLEKLRAAIASSGVVRPERPPRSACW